MPHVCKGWLRPVPGRQLKPHTNVALYQKAALYVSRIIAGASPGDLPVELPTRVVLLVNLTSAKTINRELPLSILIRADELE
jgi:ABC-type uncharacterized transport system substrate-binding protein